MSSRLCILILLLYQLSLLKVSSCAAPGGYLSPAITAPSNWVRVHLPPYRKPGETAQLHCDYDLANDTLYAVKWYKDEQEFYRYVAKERPPASSHQVDGIFVDVCRSDSRRVVLRAVTLRSGGLYRCEVSAEAPSFASAQSDARMEVISLPTEDPAITGVRAQYHIGDEISLNCTSSASYPASLLHWYINDQQVTSNKALMRYRTSERGAHEQGLRTTVLGLCFALNQRHFLGGSMSVKCVASLSPPSLVQNMPIKDHQQELLGEWSTLMLVKSSSTSLLTSWIIFHLTFIRLTTCTL